MTKHESFGENLVRKGLNCAAFGIAVIAIETAVKAEQELLERGYFTDADIREGYDASRPITESILESIDKNRGTIVFGDAYSGKSTIPKRIMIEVIRKVR